MRRTLTVLCGLLLAGMAWSQTLNYDFAAGTDLKAYPQLKTSRVKAEIVAEGKPGQGACLRFSNLKPDKYCPVDLKDLGTLGPNLVLSFDHRETIEAGKEAAYLGIILTCEGKEYWGSDAFSDQWRHCEIPLARLSPTTGGTLALGQALQNIQLYGRAKGDTLATMTVWLDNVRLETKEQGGQLSDKIRTSYANPPFFNWKATGGRTRLEYSQDPSFPRRRTYTVEDGRNFFMPPQPLTPGTWYWRVAFAGGLLSGYSATERIEIPAEAHRFVTVPVPVAQIAAKAHPRVIPLAPDDGKTREDLIRQFESYARTPVPDDPPAYAPGNPDWPTWIDWYGKVAGGITGGTGRRLQLMAQYCVQTGEPRLRQTLKPLVFKAASWNPDGGSAMKNGDIGAHHLLRGLAWCYDALYQDLTPDERKQLQDVIIARGNQFWKSLNPFKIGHSEYNNHAWLQALGLAEAGLILQGERPEVADWAEYVRQLYQGLFLACLGYQGDNNEGIAYWGYGLSFVIDYADTMKRVCGIDFFRHPWLSQTARFPMYSAPPGAWAVSFADTGQPNHGTRGPDQKAQVGALARRTGDPYALWYSGAMGPVDGLLPKPPVDLPQSMHYRFIGWSLFNTSLTDGREGVTFALRSGPFWAGHQHEDQNSFVLHAYGEKLAIDGGHYDWYGSPHFEKYSVLTRAHNALLVNGKDQDSRKPGADGKILAWLDSVPYGYVVGDASDPDMYQGQLQRWERRALFIKPGFVVLHDNLQAKEAKAKYDWLLHTVAAPKVDAVSQSFALTSGQAGLAGKFLLPRDLKLSVTKGYPVEPVDRYSTRPVPPERYVWEWTLNAAPASGRGAEDFLTVLQVQRGQAPAAQFAALPTQKGVGARIVEASQTHLVLFRSPGAVGNLEGGKVQTDAAAAAVTLDNRGNPLRLALIRGTFLRYDNKPLVFTSGGPADVTMLVTPDGSLCEAQSDVEVRLSLPAVGNRTELLLDGQNVAERKGQAGVFPLTLEPGPHRLVWGKAPAAVPSHPLPPLNLGGSRLEGYARREADGLLSTWWGTLQVPAQDRYTFRLKTGPGAPLPQVNLDGRTLPLAAEPGGGQAQLWLSAGAHSLTVTSRGSVTGAELQGGGAAAAPARLLPADFQPAAGSLLMEAEKPVAEGEVKGLIVEKVGASGKMAHGT